MSVTANTVIAVAFSVWFALLLAELNVVRREERERRREAHIRRLERECGLDEYPWGDQR